MQPIKEHIVIAWTVWMVIAKATARDKNKEYCNGNGHVKVMILYGNEKSLKFHNGQFRFMVPFMLCADPIFTPLDEIPLRHHIQWR